MAGLLGPEELPAATLHEVADPAWPVLLVCDHASGRIPARLGELGLDETARSQHIAWDIGAGELARALADRLRLPLVMHNYSRLVIDCNRQLADPTSIPERSDGTVIPGNIGLDAALREERAAALFRPYHQLIEQRLAAFACAAPAIIAIHSFTPLMDGWARPWHLGVLWDSDARIAGPLLAALRAVPELVVGDNEPYSGRHPADYTMDQHGEAARRPHVSIEVRQDLLLAPGGPGRWSGVLADALRPILADEELYRLLPFPQSL